MGWQEACKRRDLALVSACAQLEVAHGVSMPLWAANEVPIYEKRVTI